MDKCSFSECWDDSSDRDEYTNLFKKFSTNTVKMITVQELDKIDASKQLHDIDHIDGVKELKELSSNLEKDHVENSKIFHDSKNYANVSFVNNSMTHDQDELIKNKTESIIHIKQKNSYENLNYHYNLSSHLSLNSTYHNSTLSLPHPQRNLSTLINQTIFDDDSNNTELRFIERFNTKKLTGKMERLINRMKKIGKNGKSFRKKGPKVKVMKKHKAHKLHKKVKKEYVEKAKIESKTKPMAKRLEKVESKTINTNKSVKKVTNLKVETKNSNQAEGNKINSLNGMNNANSILSASKIQNENKNNVKIQSNKKAEIKPIILYDRNVHSKHVIPKSRVIIKNNIDRSIIHNYANIIRIKLDHIERYLDMMKSIYDNSASMVKDFSQVKVDSKSLTNVPKNDESFLKEYEHLLSLIKNYRNSLDNELGRDNLGHADSKLRFISHEVGIIADRFGNESKRMLSSFKFNNIKRLLYKQSKENSDSNGKN
jgi:predicted DNA-binding WGR domain protein